METPKYPSPSKPLILNYGGDKLPSLKNSRNLGWVKGKDGKKIPRLFKSKEVENWLEGIETSLLSQFEKQGSPVVPKGVPIVMWTEIVVLSTTVIPNKDGDNLQTTIQETLQPKTRNAGIVGFVDDDKQIVAHNVWVKTQPRLLREFATVYAWALDEPYFYPMSLAKFMLEFYIPQILQGDEFAEVNKGAIGISDMWEDIENLLANM